MITVEHRIPNGAGFEIGLYQTWDETRLNRSRRPLLIVPGYGMNSFIFSYHPNGRSLEGYLCEQGFEVWRIDMRGQGTSTRIGGSMNYSLEDLALVDLKVGVSSVIKRTKTDTTRVDILGASLGGTLMFLLAALDKDAPLGSLVALGAPVRWVQINPLIRLAFGSPTLVGLVRFRGTRKLAHFLLPQIVRFTPWILSIYMNPEITDTSTARELVKTVEDPNRFINRQIAQWIRSRDLMIKEKNLSEEIRTIRNPLLCVFGNRDGIVPVRTAEFPYYTVKSEVRALLEVGAHDFEMAHADLYISRESEGRVFEPVAQWLEEQNRGDFGTT